MIKGYYDMSPRIPPRIPKRYYEKSPRIPRRIPKRILRKESKDTSKDCQRIPPRIRKGYYKPTPRILQGNSKGTMKYIKDIRRTLRTQREQARASKDSMGTDWRKEKNTHQQSAEGRGRRHRAESCTVDLNSKKERPKEIAGLTKEEGSEPRCR